MARVCRLSGRSQSTQEALARRTRQTASAFFGERVCAALSQPVPGVGDYSEGLVARLQSLVQAGHDLLYSGQGDFNQRLRHYASAGFAQDVRRHWPWVLASFILLFGPMIGAMLAIAHSPEWAYLVLTPEQVAKFEMMYADGAGELGRTAREASTDFEMFGFYIYNNVSIGFRCFAGGLTAGALTVFSLVFNGLHMGVVEGRLLHAGLGHNFYSFVAGHSAFELGAIVLSGACGLKLGAAIIAPGRRSRTRALAESAREVLGMVCGLSVMLVAAALVEAFWSPLKLALPIKLSVGGLLLLLTLAYFFLAGRKDES